MKYTASYTAGMQILINIERILWLIPLDDEILNWIGLCSHIVLRWNESVEHFDIFEQQHATRTLVISEWSSNPTLPCIANK